ncbi:sacsin N-terminal ATP-binding-like domain-containing protein [Natronosalvus amylolyticus]|uniref:sacsin N-terminal ATP-binding-like domain-containing protein n=1 Tax=Natronosalvus amylolyticus TaxID=2961994 RepID=UPI0020C9AD68|nr:hypothetical protein [Natronosalvus amylolyticus]
MPDTSEGMDGTFDSLGKNPRTNEGLRTHWAGYWEDLVADLQDDSLEVLDGQPNLRSAFRKDTSLGQSERTIAEDHPNREILELLQNARDEAQYADDGQVFIAVTDEGLLIANNGRSFNFHNRSVEEAATGIGKTSKDTPDEIGKMGIGLKSILGKGESFEVWTETPDASGEQQALRVRFSKAYLLATILNSIGYDHGVDGLSEEFNTDVFPVDLDLSRNQDGKSPADLSVDNRRALMQLFLFAYPIPLSLSARRSELAGLADYLVHGDDRVAAPNDTVAEYGGEFSTAVFVEFADENWREIVTELYGVDAVNELPDDAVEESGIATTSPERVWWYVDGTRSGSLDPETLVHFGTIDEVNAVRVSDNEIDEHISWNIEPEPGVLSGESVQHTEWQVTQVNRDGAGEKEAAHVFDGFRLPASERDHGTRVLVPRPSDEWPIVETRQFGDREPHSLKDYPLYLYYPISQRDPGLSFSLHGEFSVTPNRQNIKDVSQRYVDYNRRVLEEATEVVGRVAEQTAAVTEPTHNWLSLYPWVLLPNQSQEGEWEPEARPTEADELLGYLRQQLLDRVWETDCIPIAGGSSAAPAQIQSETDGPGATDSLLLDWLSDGWDGVRAMYLLSDQLPVTGAAALKMGDRPFGSAGEECVPVAVPAVDRIWGLSQLRTASGDRLVSRIESLLRVTDENKATVTTRLRGRWFELVSEALARSDHAGDGESGVQCAADPADAVLRVTARYFEPVSGSEISELLGEEYQRTLDGVYLLPCQLKQSGAGEESETVGEMSEKRVLLQIENQDVRSEGDRRQPLSRTILWNVPSDATDVIAPPEDGQFTVFFLAELDETDDRINTLLNEAGESWGIRKYQTDRQEYFRSLVASFEHEQNNRVSPTALQFLAERVDDFTAADLNTLPDGYVAHELLETVLKNREYGRLRTRFRLRQASLTWPSPSETERAEVPLGACEFGPQWRPFLNEELEDYETDVLQNPALSLDSVLTRSEDSSRSTVVSEPLGASLGVGETTLPGPFEPVWGPVYAQMETTDPVTAARGLARTLSLFGVGVTPNVSALCHHGPGLRKPNDGVTKASWDPREWELPESDPYRSDVATLQRELIEDGQDLDSPAYLSFVTGFGNHSVQTGKHTSSHCHGRPYTADRGYGARISSWVWSTDLQRVTADPAGLIQWLERHEDTLRETVLETGWYCDGGTNHIQRPWSETVPTVFNWQLRNAACWDPVFDDQFSGWVDESWGEDAVRLRWAVQDGGRGEVTQLLPTVPSDSEPDQQVSDDLLSSFGVEPIDELTAIQAADRLQKLQEVLATEDSLDDVHRVRMRTDGVESAWMYVYTELLNPILQSLADPVEHVPSVLESELLTHLPLRFRNKEWCAVPIEQIQGDGNTELEFKYHTQRSLRQWEKQEARNNLDLYLLKPPTRGGLTPLADALGISSLDVDQPILQADELDGLSEDGVQPVKQELERRTEWILATLNRSNPDTIRESRDTFQTAIDNLACAPLHEEQTDDFFDTRSRLYRVSDDDDAPLGIVLNDDDDKIWDSDSQEIVEATAAGIAFLFEMPGRYEEIQPALRPSLPSPEKLEREWEQRGHDLDLVRTALGVQDQRELLRDIEALYELIEALGGDTPNNVERIRSNLADTDSGTIPWVRSQFQPGTDAEETPEPQSPQVAEAFDLLSEAGTRLPSELGSDTATPLFETVIAEQNTAHEQWVNWSHALAVHDGDVTSFIQWVAANSRLITEQWIPSHHARWCARVEQFCILRDEREDADLASIAALEDVLPSIETDDSIAWEDTPEATANLSGADFSPADRWFDVAPQETFGDRVLTPLIETVSEHAPGGRKEDVAVALRDFILNGEVPASQVDSRTKQQNVFQQVQSQLDGGLDLSNGLVFGQGRTTVATFGGGSGSENGDGNSPRIYGERGERAEAAAVIHILQRLGRWLDEERNDFDWLMTELAELEADQDSAGYKWHTKNRWNGSLKRYLKHEFSAKDYQSLDRFTDGDSNLWEDPFVQILNATQEYGLGFDFIDPFGPAATQDQNSTPTLDIAPVEVKAAGLSSESESVSFRFSTNQLRQARAFVSAGYQYVIRLFATPGIESEEWLQETQIVDEIILNEENPPGAALGGLGSEVRTNGSATIPADAVAGGEMYIERIFE